MGALDPVHAVDDRAVLVDRPVVRDLVFRLHHAARSRPARPAAAVHSDRLGGVFHRLSAAVLVRSALRGRALWIAFHGADELRQTVQSGAVAAHRAARRHLGPARRTHRIDRRTVDLARVDGLDRPLDFDDVSAPFLRPAHGPGPRISRDVAAARRGRIAAPLDDADGRPQAACALRFVWRRRRDRRCRGDARRRVAVALLAGHRARARSAQLPRHRRAWVPEDRGRPADPRRARSLRAVSPPGPAQLAVLDAQRAGRE